jgi:hypothetical protein
MDHTEARPRRGDQRVVSFAGAGLPPIDPHFAELSALVTRAERNRAEVARLAAERAVICAEALDVVALRVAQRAASRGTREFGDTIPLREVVAELAAALRVGERTISGWLGDGAALVSDYPATLEALRSGRIDERHASAIVDIGAPLTDENRARFQELVLPLAETSTAVEVREVARVIAARLQPDIVEERARDALGERRVRTYPLHDGLARLLLDAPAALVQGIFERVTDMADALTTEATDSAEAGDARDEEPDSRTVDQRRADIVCDLLLSGAPAAHGDDGALGAIRATVRIQIPILTLAGLDDTPAVLAGHGPVDATTARLLAASAPAWQRVMTHPVTEEPLHVDTYRPSTRLRRLLDARDRHCRWPGCRRVAHRSDADHTIAFAEGGATRAHNLAILCRGHHRVKHASSWHIEHAGGGRLIFTSPTRRRYRNDAPPVMEATAGQPWWHRAMIPYDPSDPAGF